MLLVLSVFTFAGCGNDTATDDMEPTTHVEESTDKVENNDTVKDDVENMGEDLKDGVEDMGDDIKDGEKDTKDVLDPTERTKADTDTTNTKK